MNEHSSHAGREKADGSAKREHDAAARPQDADAGAAAGDHEIADADASAGADAFGCENAVGSAPAEADAGVLDADAPGAHANADADGNDDENMLLFEKLATLQHLLMRGRFARTPHGRGPVADPMRGQGRILALLKVKDGISTKDMSSILGVRTSSLNELLSKLERKGFIVREQSPKDKRVMLVKLTDRGRAVEQPAPTNGAASMFDCLAEEEKASFGSYLDRIIARIESEMGAADEGGFEAMRREREDAFRRFFGDDGLPGEGGFPPFGGFDGRGRHGGFDGRRDVHRRGRDGGRCAGGRGNVHRGDA